MVSTLHPHLRPTPSVSTQSLPHATVHKTRHPFHISISSTAPLSPSNTREQLPESRASSSWRLQQVLHRSQSPNNVVCHCLELVLGVGDRRGDDGVLDLEANSLLGRNASLWLLLFWLLLFWLLLKLLLLSFQSACLTNRNLQRSELLILKLHSARSSRHRDVGQARLPVAKSQVLESHASRQSWYLRVLLLCIPSSSAIDRETDGDRREVVVAAKAGVDELLGHELFFLLQRIQGKLHIFPTHRPKRRIASSHVHSPEHTVVCSSRHCDRC
jgi:hypothetical protein